MKAEALRQQALVEALLRASAPLPPGLCAPAGIEGGVARGLQAYRLNAQALAARALAGVYPAVQDWLGEADFAAMAWAFWRQHPPSQGDLACWGAALPDFLAAQPGMEPALGERARLDWAIHQCERAPDARLDAASLSLLAAAEPAELRLRPMPGLSLLWLRDEAVPAAAWPWLLWRRDWRCQQRRLSAGEAAFFAALLAGRDLEQALQEASAVAADFDFSAWLQDALSLGWLRAVEPITGKE